MYNIEDKITYAETSYLKAQREEDIQMASLIEDLEDCTERGSNYTRLS
jgi:hypothetical protein